MRNNKPVFTLLLTLSLLTASATAQLLQPAEMKADLAILKSSWENLHPGIYRYNTASQIDELFKDIGENVKVPKTQREFFLLLSQLAIKLKCGHTFVSFYNQKKEIEDNLFSRAYFPFLFKVVEGKLVITHPLSNTTSIGKGDEILAINEIASSKIISALLTVSKSDGNNGLNKQLDNIGISPPDISPRKYTLFDIYFPLFFKKNINDSIFHLKIRGVDKTIKKYKVKAMTKEERQVIFQKLYGELPAQEKSWYVKPISEKVVLFRLGDFAIYNWKFDFKKYLDSIFSEFKTKNYQHLIIDIRQNEGGTDAARDEVISYIIAEPIICYNRIRRFYKYVTIPDSLLPFLKTWDPSFKKPKPRNQFTYTSTGLYEQKVIGCDTLNPKPNRFNGDVYLITDATNSSATFMMADIFKKNKLGTIVGESTGGSQQGINGGELFFLYLPNSKFEIDLPLVYQTSDPNRPDEGIHPDFEIRTTKKDIRTGNDPQLNFILKKLIRLELSKPIAR